MFRTTFSNFHQHAFTLEKILSVWGKYLPYTNYTKKNHSISRRTVKLVPVPQHLWNLQKQNLNCSLYVLHKRTIPYTYSYCCSLSKTLRIPPSKPTEHLPTVCTYTTHVSAPKYAATLLLTFRASLYSQ